MPAASDATPGPVSGPVVRSFRPLGVRIAIAVFGTMLLSVCTAIWIAFGPTVRAEFTVFERLTLLAIGLGLFAGGYALARSRVVARTDGLVVVNGYRTRRFAWAEVVAITLRPGSPWAMLDLSDGTSVAAMGIQGSDGGRATRHVREVRGLIERYSHTDQDD